MDELLKLGFWNLEKRTSSSSVHFTVPYRRSSASVLWRWRGGVFLGPHLGGPWRVTRARQPNRHHQLFLKDKAPPYPPFCDEKRIKKRATGGHDVGQRKGALWTRSGRVSAVLAVLATAPPVLAQHKMAPQIRPTEWNISVDKSFDGVSQSFGRFDIV